MEDKRLKLKPTLGLLDATAISVGAIIGAGIFVVTGSRLHPKYNTFCYAIWISGVVMALLALSVDLTRMVAVSTFGQLVYYALANASDLKLRVSKGDP